MASRADRYPAIRRSFDHDASVRLPGRGPFRSMLLALLAVIALLAIGVSIVVTYLEATEDASAAEAVWTTDAR